jgi:pyruvate dehydrogenase E1 component alpha subunit
MTTSTAAPETTVLRELYTAAVRIKTSDERYRALMQSGAIGGMYYSPRGQEFAAVSVAAHLRPDDQVVTTYRGLHDQIAKGVPLRDLWAEFLGRAAGTCGGKGGPMHVTAPDHGLMLTTGVVGSGLPIANGLALAAQLQARDRVVVVNFGDGASNIGAFHESLNLASLWKLPVVFVCQNNLYAEYTPLRGGTTVERIADRAASYSMPGVTADGNDPVELWTAAGEAVRRARRGEGPTLLEALTYRFCGHVMGDQQVYIPADELADAIAADPVLRFRERLLTEGVLTEEELAGIEKAAADEVADAAEYALASAAPEVSALTADVYATPEEAA